MFESTSSARWCVGADEFFGKRPDLAVSQAYAEARTSLDGKIASVEARVEELASRGSALQSEIAKARVAAAAAEVAAAAAASGSARLSTMVTEGVYAMREHVFDAIPKASDDQPATESFVRALREKAKLEDLNNDPEGVKQRLFQMLEKSELSADQKAGFVKAYEKAAEKSARALAKAAEATQAKAAQAKKALSTLIEQAESAPDHSAEIKALAGERDALLKKLTALNEAQLKWVATSARPGIADAAKAAAARTAIESLGHAVGETGTAAALAERAVISQAGKAGLRAFAARATVRLSGVAVVGGALAGPGGAFAAELANQATQTGSLGCAEGNEDYFAWETVDGRCVARPKSDDALAAFLALDPADRQKRWKNEPRLLAGVCERLRATDHRSWRATCESNGYQMARTANVNGVQAFSVYAVGDGISATVRQGTGSGATAACLSSTFSGPTLASAQPGQSTRSFGKTCVEVAAALANRPSAARASSSDPFDPSAPSAGFFTAFARARTEVSACCSGKLSGPECAAYGLASDSGRRSGGSSQ